MPGLGSDMAGWAPPRDTFARHAPGPIAILFESATRLENGIPTPYGRFDLGFPLAAGFPLDLGPIPAGSRISIPATLPSAIPPGTVFHFQAFVGGAAPKLTPPVTLIVN